MSAFATRGLALLLAASLAGGCSAVLRRGDRAFAAGNCPQALEAYTRILSEGLPTRRLDRVLFQAGLCLAQPGTTNFDRERTRQYLTRLVRAYPKSPWALPARLLLEREAQAARLERDLEGARQLLAQSEQEIAALERQQGAAEPQTGELERAADPTTVAELVSLRGKVSRLTQELAARNADIERLTKALAALKEIDLGSPPP